MPGGKLTEEEWCSSEACEARLAYACGFRDAVGMLERVLAGYGYVADDDVAMWRRLKLVALRNELDCLMIASPETVHRVRSPDADGSTMLEMLADEFGLNLAGD